MNFDSERLAIGCFMEFLFAGIAAYATNMWFTMDHGPLYDPAWGNMMIGVMDLCLMGFPLVFVLASLRQGNDYRVTFPPLPHIPEITQHQAPQQNTINTNGLELQEWPPRDEEEWKRWQ